MSRRLSHSSSSLWGELLPLISSKFLKLRLSINYIQRLWLKWRVSYSSPPRPCFADSGGYCQWSRRERFAFLDKVVSDPSSQVERPGHLRKKCQCRSLVRSPMPARISKLSQLGLRISYFQFLIPSKYTRSPPLFIVGSSHDPSFSPSPPEVLVSEDAHLEGVPPSISSQVLATMWHMYSDEAIQTTIANQNPSESPADVVVHPYHTALRVLSYSVHNLSRVRVELEETRKLLREKELERKRKADLLLKEVPPSDQDAVRRVVQALFSEADIEPRVRRKHSVLVRPLNLEVSNI